MIAFLLIFTIYVAGGLATGYLIGRFDDTADPEWAAFAAMGWFIFGWIFIPMYLFQFVAKKGMRDAK